MIHEPTRISCHKASLLDNILTNVDAYCESGILLCDVSDHLPVFSFTNVSIQLNTDREESCGHKRLLTDANILKFSHLLSTINWHDYVHFEDTNENYNSFISILMTLYNECSPVTLIRKQKQHKKPWYSSHLRKLCNKRLRFYRKYLKNPTNENKIRYNSIRNFVTKEIRKAKKNYYNQRFKDANGNMSGTWIVINNLLGKNKKIKLPEFKDDGITISNEAVAKGFNDFFVNVASKMLSEFPNASQSNLSPTAHIENNLNTFFCKPI